MISGNQTWKPTFIFDRFGNRKFDASQTTTLGDCPPAVIKLSFDKKHASCYTQKVIFQQFLKIFRGENLERFS
jgi:hypothetical protein